MGFLSLVIFLEKKKREREQVLSAAGDAAWEFKGAGTETAAQLATFNWLEMCTVPCHLVPAAG